MERYLIVAFRVCLAFGVLFGITAIVEGIMNSKCPEVSRKFFHSFPYKALNLCRKLLSKFWKPLSYVRYVGHKLNVHFKFFLKHAAVMAVYHIRRCVRV